MLANRLIRRLVAACLLGITSLAVAAPPEMEPRIKEAWEARMQADFETYAQQAIDDKDLGPNTWQSGPGYYNGAGTMIKARNRFGNPASSPTLYDDAAAALTDWWQGRGAPVTVCGDYTGARYLEWGGGVADFVLEYPTSTELATLDATCLADPAWAGDLSSTAWLQYWYIEPTFVNDFYGRGTNTVRDVAMYKQALLAGERVGGARRPNYNPAGLTEIEDFDYEIEAAIYFSSWQTHQVATGNYIDHGRTVPPNPYPEISRHSAQPFMYEGIQKMGDIRIIEWERANGRDENDIWYDPDPNDSVYTWVDQLEQASEYWFETGRFHRGQGGHEFYDDNLQQGDLLYNTTGYCNDPQYTDEFGCLYNNYGNKWYPAYTLPYINACIFYENGEDPNNPGNCTPDFADAGIGYTVLFNQLIAPGQAWLWKETANPKYRIRYDNLIDAAVGFPQYVCSDTQYTDQATCEANSATWSSQSVENGYSNYNGKGVVQQGTFGFEGMAWREEGPPPPEVTAIAKVYTDIQNGDTLNISGGNYHDGYSGANVEVWMCFEGGVPAFTRTGWWCHEQEDVFVGANFIAAFFELDMLGGNENNVSMYVWTPERGESAPFELSDATCWGACLTRP